MTNLNSNTKWSVTRDRDPGMVHPCPAASFFGTACSPPKQKEVHEGEASKYIPKFATEWMHSTQSVANHKLSTRILSSSAQLKHRELPSRSSQHPSIAFARLQADAEFASVKRHFEAWREQLRLRDDRDDPVKTLHAIQEATDAMMAEFKIHVLAVMRMLFSPDREVTVTFRLKRLIAFTWKCFFHMMTFIQSRKNISVAKKRASGG